MKQIGEIQPTIGKKGKKPAPHPRAEAVEALCLLFHEPVKKNFGKWNGFTKGIPVSEINRMKQIVAKEGNPPKRLFIYLVREWRKKICKK